MTTDSEEMKWNNVRLFFLLPLAEPQTERNSFLLVLLKDWLIKQAKKKKKRGGVPCESPILSLSLSLSFPSALFLHSPLTAHAKKKQTRNPNTDFTI